MGELKGQQSKQKPNVASVINNLLSPFIFSSNLWRKLIALCVVKRDSQDMLTALALVRCVYERITTALASHSLQCCLRFRRLCSVEADITLRNIDVNLTLGAG